MAEMNPFGMMPPELSGDYNAVLRKQKIMEALMMQGMQPRQAPQVKGRFEVPVGIAGPIGQMAQAFMGSRGLQEADTQMADVGRRYQSGQQAEMGNVLQMMQGRPEIPVPTDEAGGGPGAPAAAANPQAAIMKALMSQYPGVRSMGTAMAPNLRNQVVGRSLLSPAGSVLGSDPIYAQEQKANRDAQLVRDRERREDQAARDAERAAEARIRDRDRASDKEAYARLVAGLRPPRNEPTPSISEVIDPKDPSRLIRVDTRVYRPGGTLGDPGVLGVAGKEPAAARREIDKVEGQKNLKETVDSLATSYGNLARSKTGVSPTQSPLKNLWERAAASGPGQLIAGAVGTEAQTERDNIARSRALLMGSLKQATGMSAQQLNSNVELSFYLQGATDPARSREANQAALAYFDKRFGLGLGITATPKGLQELGKPPVASGAIRPPPSAGGVVDFNDLPR